MKRFIVIAIAAALCAQLPAVYAQDVSEPDEETVLEKAREKYAEEDGMEDPGDFRGNPEESGSSNPDTVGEPSETSEEWPTAPWVVSFVPGIQNPLGLYDTPLALGAVGSAVGNVLGIQASGVFSLAAGDVNGFQGAGVFNMASGSVNGFQGAGVFNMARDVDGFQGAGVFNLAEAVDGFQVSGCFNIAGDIEGFQVSGCFNIADTVDGGMFSPVFNAADSVDGVMIALVNVADHADGVVIGLVNLIGDGVNELGIQYVPAEDMTYVLYKTGTSNLYAVYYGGAGAEDWFEDADSLIVGAGVGHRFPLLGGGMDVEFCAEQELYSQRQNALRAAAEADDEDAFWNLLCPYPALRVSLNAPLFRNMKVFLGIEVDFDVPDWGSSVPDRLRVNSFDTREWSGELFGVDYTAWPKLFFGVSL